MGIFQKLLSHAAISAPPFPFPLFFHTALLPSLFPPCYSHLLVLWWDVRTEHGGWETIDRASILSGEMFPCDKAKPLLAESGPDLCCTLARTHFGQRHSRQGTQGQLEHMVLYGRSKKKRTTKKVSHCQYLSEKLNKSACRDKITLHSVQRRYYVTMVFRLEV